MAKKQKNEIHIMVCVTNQRSCDRLMARGAERLAAAVAETGAPEGGVSQARMHVVHCVETGHKFMNNPYESDAIEYLFTAAQLAGADLSLLRAENVDDALVEYAQANSISLIVLGAGNPGTNPKDHISMRLQRRLPGVSFDIVPME